MRKKNLLWLLLFILLIIVNLFITLSYVKKVKRLQAASQILDEIEGGYGSTDQFNQSAKTVDEPEVGDQVGIADARVANLKRFLRRYNSPLYEHAEYIVATADKNNMDYRLLPAIAMQESGLCAKIPENSYNCWGWGIYAHHVTRFNDYEDAIDNVSRGLKKNYIDHGLVTASQIMAKYNPSSNGSWANGVNTFLQALE